MYFNIPDNQKMFSRIFEINQFGFRAADISIGHFLPGPQGNQSFCSISVDWWKNKLILCSVFPVLQTI